MIPVPQSKCIDCGRTIWYRVTVTTAIGQQIRGWVTRRDGTPQRMRCRETNRLHRPEEGAMSAGLILNERVQARLNEALDYINQMAYEREGAGADQWNEVQESRESFQNALGVLLISNEVWIDGGEGLSFGGNLEGIVYGMIARYKESAPAGCKPAVYWTFHS